MKLNKAIISILFVIFLLPIVYGFGVTTPYWDTNPLVMSPGQNVNFHLLLQNMVGEENIVATAKVSSGDQFMDIIDTNEEYLVPLGSRDVQINLNVNIPEDTPNGDHILGLVVTTFPDTPTGMVQFGAAIEQKIPLKIVGGAPPPNPPDLAATAHQEKPTVEEKKINTGFIVALIILVAIGLLSIVFLLKRKKDS